MYLILTLENLRAREDMDHFKLATDGPYNSLRNVWWKLPEWLQSYLEGGVVTGVRIYAKDIYNVYKLPLATINGRKHEGNAVVCAMAFLEGEHEVTVSWFLTELLRVVKRSPMVVS